MPVYNDNSQSIGRTPLVRLRRVAPLGGASILAKIEGRNPAYSVKCRIGAAMIWDAEEKGLLRPGMEILEPTSGNTGIALAFVAASRGYPVTIVMPETMSIERRKVLKSLGARIVLTEGPRGMKGAVTRAEELVATDPGRYFIPQQFSNPANPAIHLRTTGPEIWDDTDGQVDAFVSGVGTGGTLTGVSRYFKQVRGRQILSVAVEPAESPVITQCLAGLPLQPSPHRIQGIGAGFIPEILDLSVIDRVLTVTSDEAIDFTRRLIAEEGILCGISSGAAALATVRLASEPGMAGRTIVTVLPDTGERYLSGPLFVGVFQGVETAVAGEVL